MEEASIDAGMQVVVIGRLLEELAERIEQGDCYGASQTVEEVVVSAAYLLSVIDRWTSE